MAGKRSSLSAYRAMWMVAMFDLPVETKENRRHYVRFRNTLLKDGFMMLQYSVYARYIPSEEAAETHRRTVRLAIPPLGQVRLMALTDHQFGKMEVFHGRRPKKPEAAPEQFLLF
jgi:CRISPR-associated protein Cas2